MIRTVVVGGGAAGIAAARRLHDAGREVLLLEARDRLGGRARSVTLSLPPTTPSNGAGSSTGESPSSAGTTKVVVDAGCGWLHSAGRNPWTRIAERAGFAIDRSSPQWDRQWRDLGYPRAEQQAFGAAWDRWEAAARAALDGPDRPLSAFVAPDDRWRPMLDAISNYANGAPLDQVSLKDWVAYEDASTEDNWALPAGYGTLIVGHAASVPVRLDSPVTRIDHRGGVLRIDTPAGRVEADRVILSVPTTAYAGIVFDPPLHDKHAAAEALPLGLADKVFLAVDRPEWPAHAHLIGDPRTACTASHRLSPFGWPIIESFLGGTCAEGLEDERAAAAFAIDELVALLGSGWRDRLRPLAATRWRAERHIHGSYSHARIGAAGQRRMLAKPVDQRLFFAGEACSESDFSTAHGAYRTGIAAADAVLASAGDRIPPPASRAAHRAVDPAA